MVSIHLCSEEEKSLYGEIVGWICAALVCILAVKNAQQIRVAI